MALSRIGAADRCCRGRCDYGRYWREARRERRSAGSISTAEERHGEREGRVWRSRLDGLGGRCGGAWKAALAFVMQCTRNALSMRDSPTFFSRLRRGKVDISITRGPPSITGVGLHGTSRVLRVLPWRGG